MLQVWEVFLRTQYRDTSLVQPPVPAQRLFHMVDGFTIAAPSFLKSSTFSTLTTTSTIALAFLVVMMVDLSAAALLDGRDEREKSAAASALHSRSGWLTWLGCDNPFGAVLTALCPPTLLDGFTMAAPSFLKSSTFSTLTTTSTIALAFLVVTMVDLSAAALLDGRDEREKSAAASALHSRSGWLT